MPVTAPPRPIAVPACTSTRSPARPGRPASSPRSRRPTRCAPGPATDDLAQPALVAAGDADLVGALRASVEQAGVLEADVGQLPQQVVEQHEPAGCGHAAGRGRRATARGRPHPLRAGRRCRSRSWWRPMPGPAHHRAHVRVGRGRDGDHMSPGRTESAPVDESGPVSATAGNARLPMITGCTNSTATCRACGSHDGATHHMVAPAANRLASGAVRCSRGRRPGDSVHDPGPPRRARAAPRPRPAPAPGPHRSAGRCGGSTP